MKQNIFQFFLPILYLIIITFFIISQELYSQNYILFGLNPSITNGFWAIFSAPLLHSDFGHYISNVSALILCFYIVFILYKNVASIIFIISYILPGIFTWIIGRPAFHIGASGLIYSFVFFILFVGFLSKKRDFLAIAFVVLVIHSGIIWGVLPINEKISWEYHLGGAITGILLALSMYKFSFTKDSKSSLYSNISITGDVDIVYVEKSDVE